MDQLFEFAGNHLILVSLLAAILIMLIWNIYGSAITGIKLLSPMEVTRLVNRENAVLLDVRSSNDFKNGHILSSISVPDSELATRRESLEKYKGKVVIACCEHGTVSDRVARSLKASGFEQVYCLKGGIGSWRGANMPLTKE